MQKPVRTLLRFNFQRHPDPIHAASHGVTKSFADRHSAHPFHIRTLRRLASFDPTKLHWKVSVPVDLSRSAYIRDRTKRRVREAVAAELRARGWERDGSVRKGSGEDGTEQRKALGGAMGLGVLKDPAILLASGEEIREAARWVVDKLVHGQDHVLPHKGKAQGSFTYRRMVFGDTSRDLAEVARDQGWNVQRERHG